eukprot:IDg9067t1
MQRMLIAFISIAHIVLAFELSIEAIFFSFTIFALVMSFDATPDANRDVQVYVDSDRFELDTHVKRSNVHICNNEIGYVESNTTIMSIERLCTSRLKMSMCGFRSCTPVRRVQDALSSEKLPWYLCTPRRAAMRDRGRQTELRTQKICSVLHAGRAPAPPGLPASGRFWSSGEAAYRLGFVYRACAPLGVRAEIVADQAKTTQTGCLDSQSRCARCMSPSKDKRVPYMEFSNDKKQYLLPNH